MQQLATSSMTRSSLLHKTLTQMAVFDEFGSVALLLVENLIALCDEPSSQI